VSSASYGYTHNAINTAHPSLSTWESLQQVQVVLHSRTMTMLWNTLIFLVSYSVVRMTRGSELSLLRAPDGYNAYNISFSLYVDGQEKPQRNCQAYDDSFPEACLTAQGKVSWDTGDSINIRYLALNISSKATAVEFRLCYAERETVDRPWRRIGSTVQVNIAFVSLVKNLFYWLTPNTFSLGKFEGAVPVLHCRTEKPDSRRNQLPRPEHTSRRRILYPVLRHLWTRRRK